MLSLSEIRAIRENLQVAQRAVLNVEEILLANESDSETNSNVFVNVFGSDNEEVDEDEDCCCDVCVFFSNSEDDVQVFAPAAPQVFGQQSPSVFGQAVSESIFPFANPTPRVFG